MHGLLLLLLGGFGAAAARRRRLRGPRYEARIKAFEAKDRVHPPTPQGTVFAGSSTFTFWRSLENTFADFNAINRGFGGAIISEVTHYAPRIVLPYQPARVVFYAGSNDIAAGRSAQQVAEDFQGFVERLWAARPGLPIYFISLIPGPRRSALRSVYDAANALVEGYIQENANLHFIDMRPVMLDSQGNVDKALFGWDRLHMNSKGYQRWTPVIRKALEARTE